MKQGENIMAFPSSKQSDWKARFQRIIDHGKGHFLCFPFTYIRNRDALFDLYEAAGEVFKKYPAVAEDFFDDAERAAELAEKSIEEDRLKTLPGDPEQLIHFNKTGAQHGKNAPPEH